MANLLGRGGGPDPFENPFAAPKLEVTGPIDRGEPGGEAEEIRRQYLTCEANVKGLGGLFLLGGIPFTIASAIMLANQLPRPDVALIPMGAGALFIAVGVGLRGLNPWARWVAVLILSAQLIRIVYSIGLARVRFGEIPEGGVVIVLAAVSLAISGLFLSTLVSRKAGVVFTREYREIVRRTPHVRLKTSLIAWIVLAAFLLFIIAVLIGGAVFG